jgi:hypothetical protein
MLGFEVAQSTVSKYMTRAPKPPSQTWKTFLRNHAEAIAGIDVVPTLTYYLVRDNDRAYGHVFTGPGEGHGYSRPPDLARIAVAKWHCGTSDRHTASRVPGPNGYLRRSAPAASSFRLCGVLQSSAHALGITERCPLASSSPTVWCHCRYSHLGRAASPIRPDMIFGKDAG